MEPDELIEEEMYKALKGIISREELRKLLKDKTVMQEVDLSQIDINPLLHMIPEHVALQYRIVPIAFENETLTVAMGDPQNVNALDDLHWILNVKIAGAVASEEQISSALETVKRFYKDASGPI